MSNEAIIVNTQTFADGEICEILEETRPGHYHARIPGRLSWELRRWEFTWLDGNKAEEVNEQQEET
jgi:hypothetical protein